MSADVPRLSLLSPVPPSPTAGLTDVRPDGVMGLLSDHLPLTLLLDLALGVRSTEVYEAEPADLSWVHRQVG